MIACQTWKPIITIFLVLLAGACSRSEEAREPPAWKESYSAAECRELMDWDAATERCGRGNSELLMNVLLHEPASCFPYSKPQRMTGVWLTGFEFSGFYEGAENYGDVLEAEGQFLDDKVWFRSNGILLPSAIDPPNGTTLYTLSAYHVDFIGRRSLCSGEYGHIGGSSNEVLVTQVLDIRTIPAWVSGSETD